MHQFTEEERRTAPVVKVCLVGDSSVGKSNICSRFVQDMFVEASIPTIGIDFRIKLMRCTKNRDNVRKLQIWDTAGGARFKNVTFENVRGAHAIVYIYDVTNRQSFEALENHYRSTQRDSGFPQAHFIVGNKIDLIEERKVTPEEGEALAAKLQCHFMEISAKESQESSSKLFQWLIDLLELPVEERKKILMMENEDTLWTKNMSNLLSNNELFRNYSGLMIYEPIVQLIAPGLLNKQVLDWIVLNIDILTPAVIQRLTTMAHFFSFEKKGLTDDNWVHLYLVSHACKFDLLGSKVVEYFGSKKDAIEQVIKNSPKLADNYVCDLNEASMLLIERVNEYKRMLATKTDPPTRKPIAELWRDLVGQLYNEREITGDFTVVINTRSCKAHNVILSFATSFFQISNSSEVSIDKDISNMAWDQLLKYFYTHDVKDITDPAAALEVLSLASYWKLDDKTASDNAPRDHTLLLQHCDTLVYDSITLDMAIDRLVAAVNRSDPVDKQITMRYCVSNYEELFDKYESRLAELPKEIMFMLLSRVIQRETKGK